MPSILLVLVVACVLPGGGIADIGASTPVGVPEAQGSAVGGDALDPTPVPLPGDAYAVPAEIGDIVEGPKFWVGGDEIPEPVRISCESDPTQDLISHEGVAYPCAGMVALGYIEVGHAEAGHAEVGTEECLVANPGNYLAPGSLWQPGSALPEEVLEMCQTTSQEVVWEDVRYGCSEVVKSGCISTELLKHCSNSDPIVGVTYPWNGNSDSGDLGVYSLTESGLILSGAMPQGSMGRLTGTLSNSNGPSYYHLDFGGDTSDVWVKSDSAYCLD